MKATKTQVQIGNLSVEGYMLEDGTFGVSQSQLSELVGFDVKSWSRYLNSKDAETLNLKGLKLVAVYVRDGLPGTPKVKLVPLEYISDMVKNLVDAGEKLNYGKLTLDTYHKTGLFNSYQSWKNDCLSQRIAKRDKTGFRDTLSEKELTKLKDFELAVALYVDDIGLDLDYAFDKAGARYCQ